MPTIKRKSPPKHILIPDTNVLWHEKKDTCASPEFCLFWDEYGVKYDIELILPEVVKGELLYQHSSAALKALERINTQFSNLSDYANKNYKHRVNSKRVQNDIETKFDSWISSLSAEVASTPISHIDWEKTIQDAIWRLPPFIEDKDKKNEKGFRDLLILETVCFIASTKDTEIAFISNDKALLSASKKRLENHKHCSFYETLDEFSSFLRLLNEKLENEFVQEIQKRAKIKFHNNNDTQCLFYREKITSQIRDKHAQEFSNPISTRPLSLAFSSAVAPFTEDWKIFSNEGVWITAPSFVAMEGENEFLWDSKITFVQLYIYTGSGGEGLLGMPFQGQENLRKLEFMVTWKARVAKDARFLKMDLVDIELVEKKFEPASEVEKEQYSVKPTTE